MADLPAKRLAGALAGAVDRLDEHDAAAAVTAATRGEQPRSGPAAQGGPQMTDYTPPTLDDVERGDYGALTGAVVPEHEADEIVDAFEAGELTWDEAWYRLAVVARPR